MILRRRRKKPEPEGSGFLSLEAVRLERYSLFRRGQHQLDAVLLIDLGRAGVVIDRDDVRLRIDLADLADHALARDRGV